MEQNSINQLSFDPKSAEFEPVLTAKNKEALPWRRPNLELIHNIKKVSSPQRRGLIYCFD